MHKEAWEKWAEKPIERMRFLDYKDGENICDNSFKWVIFNIGPLKTSTKGRFLNKRGG